MNLLDEWWVMHFHRCNCFPSSLFLSTPMPRCGHFRKFFFLTFPQTTNVPQYISAQYALEEGLMSWKASYSVSLALTGMQSWAGKGPTKGEWKQRQAMLIRDKICSCMMTAVESFISRMQRPEAKKSSITWGASASAALQICTVLESSSCLSASPISPLMKYSSCRKVLL